jgi:hypothetical protein
MNVSQSAVEEQVVEILKLVRTHLETGTTIIGEQLPGIVQELIYWKRFENIAAALFLTFMIIVGVSLIYSDVLKLERKEIANDQWCYAGAFGIVCSGFSLIILICHTLPLGFQLWLAPNIYLLEFFTQMFK